MGGHGDIIGIDPGGRETGIVLRRGDTPIRACVVVRDGDDRLPGAAYLAEVLDAVADFAGDAHSSPVVAVEGLNEPTPQMGTTSVAGLMGAALVLGAVLAHHPDAVVVAPARHGSAPLGAYPEALRPTRGRGKGHDRFRHARSAWDVAGAAALTAAFTEWATGRGVA